MRKIALLLFGRVVAGIARRLLKRSLHGRVLIGKSLDGQFLGLVIGDALLRGLYEERDDRDEILSRSFSCD